MRATDKMLEYSHIALEILADDISHPVDNVIAPVLNGLAHGLDDVHQMITHPIETLYQVTLFGLDAAIIISHASQNYSDPQLQPCREALHKEDSFYSNACRRMQERINHFETLGKEFSAASHPEKLQMATRFFTSIYVPGTVLKAAQGVSNLANTGKFNPAIYKERRLPILTKLREIKADFRWHLENWLDQTEVSVTPWYYSKKYWSSIDDIRAVSKAAECEYAYVILPNGEFRAIGAEYGGHCNLTNGQPILMGGDLVAKNGRIIKIDNRTGDYTPYLEPVIMRHVFKGLGVPEINLPGVIQETYSRANSIASGMRRSSAIKFSRAHPLAVVATDLFHTHELYEEKLAWFAESLPTPQLFSIAYASTQTTPHGETTESNNSDDKFSTSQLNNLEKKKELQEKFLHSMDLYEAVNIPLPSKPILIQPSDSTEIICAKIDAYFEDIIRNYPRKTKKLLQEMYYNNKNVQIVSLVMYGATGICFVDDSDKKIIVKIEASLSDHPITIRKTKIHEIAVHAGQIHQRINQVGFDAYIRERNNFNKFSEQSVAIMEKILIDALGEVISRELSTARNFVTEMVDYEIYHNELMTVDDYVHLKHRDNYDKLTPADHELFLRNPQVASFLSGDAQRFYPNNSGNSAPTEFFRKPLEQTTQTFQKTPAPQYAAEEKSKEMKQAPSVESNAEEKPEINFSLPDTVGHEGSRLFAKEFGKKINVAVHETFVAGEKVKEAVRETFHFSKKQTVIAKRATSSHQPRVSTKQPKNSYESHVANLNSSVRNPVESQRQHFAKMGMPEPQFASQSTDQLWHRSLDVKKGTFVEWMVNEAGEYISVRLPIAKAEARTKPVIVKRSRSSQPALSQRSAYILEQQKYFLHESKATVPAQTKTTPQKTPAQIKRGEEIQITNAFTRQKIDELRHPLRQANAIMRERSQFHQEKAAQFQTQRSIEIISTAGEVFSIASRVCRYIGSDDMGQFLSSTFSLFSGFASFIVTGGMLGLVMPFISFFLSNRAAEVAREFALMIQAASQSLQGMHQDVAEELHVFKTLLQKEIRYTGALVAEVLAAQNTQHRLNQALFQELGTLENTVGSYFANVNAYLHVLKTRDIKTKCEYLYSYLNDSEKKAVKQSPEKVHDYLDDVEFWIGSRLHHPVMNGTLYLNATDAEAINILSQQSCPLISMPSFVAGRLQIGLDENMSPDFLSLPPMTSYFPIVKLFCQTAEKHPEFLGDDKGKAIFTHIQKTLTTYGELIQFIKNNETKIRQSQLSSQEKDIILKPLSEIAVYEMAVQEMKKMIADYQKRLALLTDPVMQLEMVTRKLFGEPEESENHFWKRCSQGAENQPLSCMMSCKIFSEYDDSTAMKNKLISKLKRPNIKVNTVTIDGEKFLKVEFAATHTPTFFRPANPVAANPVTNLQLLIQP